MDEKVKRSFSLPRNDKRSGDRAWREYRALNRPNLSSYFLNEFKLAPLVILGDQVADDVR